MTSDSFYPRQRQLAFTIVELLIVIVIIGILAAITIVAYNGIQKRAQAAASQSAASQVVQKLATYQITNGSYPTQLSDVGITDGSTTYQYTVDNSATPATYCVTTTTGSTSYFINNTTTTTPAQGGCPGDGQGGQSAITNLIVNPSFESGANSWSTNASAVISGISSESYFGSSSLKVISAGSKDSGASTLVDTNTAGSYRFTVEVKCATVGVMLRALIDEYNNGVYVGQASQNFTTTGSWQQVSLTKAVTSDQIRPAVRALSTDASSRTFMIDAAMVTAGTTLYSYAAGDSPNWKWNGAPNASTSTGPLN